MRMKVTFLIRSAALVLSLAAGAWLQAQSAPEWKTIEENWKSWNEMPEASLKRAADGGDATASYFFYLRTLREEGENAARRSLGQEYLERAAEGGMPHALYQLSGQFRTKDEEKYYSLLSRAAATGLPTAQLTLALEHLEGARVPLDEAAAVDLVRRAADAGYAKAQTELGQMYASGMGEPRHSDETPRALFVKAAARGNRDEMEELGRRYLYGYGVEQDIMEAARWYWRANASGSISGMQVLDSALEPLATPDAERRRFSEFYSLYAKAQVKRESEPMRKVGEAFLNGRYGEPNAVTGYFWLRYAARKGDAAAAKLASTAKADLRPEQVSEVEQELDASQAAERAAEEARRQQRLRQGEKRKPSV